MSMFLLFGHLGTLILKISIMFALLIVVFAIFAITGVNGSSCVCTTVPCPISGTNYLTEGGGATGTYHYTTHNNIPVVTSASVTITKANLDMGTETTSCTQTYSRNLDDDGVQDCDAGHILAHRLGGPGNQPINIFPQDSNLNRGAFAQYEGQIYDCIATQGATSAYLTWSFAYHSTTRTKPDNITYSATFTNGKCTNLKQTFINYPH